MVAKDETYCGDCEHIQGDRCGFYHERGWDSQGMLRVNVGHKLSLENGLGQDFDECLAQQLLGVRRNKKKIVLQPTGFYNTNMREAGELRIETELGYGVIVTKSDDGNAVGKFHLYRKEHWKLAKSEEKVLSHDSL